MAEKSPVPYTRCGLVNKVNRSPNHAFYLGLWDKDSSTFLISTFYGRLLHILKLDSERPPHPHLHKTTILSRNSIAACIENDRLNNSVDEGAIKEISSPEEKNSFFTINYL
jgi:hypothetical protein